MRETLVFTAGLSVTIDGVAPSQRDTVAFLSSPHSYDPQPPRVLRIDTHGAHVFLSGSHVFKIKRAIHYPYMDFSTLEKRHAACARELEVNSANAPSIYRGLVAITRRGDGNLAFDEAGVPVEWAVHMARFSENDVLANRVTRQGLSVEEAKALADAVFASHLRAPVMRHPSPRSSIPVIAETVLRALPGLFDAADQDALDDFSGRLTRWIAGSRSMMEQRVLEGHVRRCHGDLHLGNIVMLDDRPTLFDAIEFDEDLATVDTLYDLAFLLMDLGKRGQRPGANIILNRYFWRSRDESDLHALAALPVFLALRASIRAMVGAQRAALSGADKTDAISYIHLGRSYLDARPPALVLIGGLSGTGKSTLASGLAPHLGRAPGAVHLRSDLERKAIFRAEEYDRLPAAAYAEQVTADVYATVARKAEAALRAGHCVIVDAVHAQETERKAIAALAHATGSTLRAFWLEAPPNVLLERVAARQRDASDATPQVVEQQMSYDLGTLDWIRLDASGSAERTLSLAMSQLRANSGPS